MNELSLIIINRAIEEGRRVRIIYQSDKDISERSIKPYGIFEDSLSAYCYLRRAKRSFKLNGILSAQLIEEKGDTLRK